MIESIATEVRMIQQCKTTSVIFGFGDWRFIRRREGDRPKPACSHIIVDVDDDPDDSDGDGSEFDVSDDVALEIVAHIEEVDCSILTVIAISWLQRVLADSVVRSDHNNNATNP